MVHLMARLAVCDLAYVEYPDLLFDLLTFLGVDRRFLQAQLQPQQRHAFSIFLTIDFHFIRWTRNSFIGQVAPTIFLIQSQKRIGIQPYADVGIPGLHGL